MAYMPPAWEQDYVTAEISEILGAYLESYAKKPAGMSDQTWLTEQLAREKEISQETAARLAERLCAAAMLVQEAEQQAQAGLERKLVLDDWLREQVPRYRQQQGDAPVLARLRRIQQAYQAAWQRFSPGEGKGKAGGAAAGITAAAAGTDINTDLPPDALSGTALVSGLTKSLQMEYQQTLKDDFGLLDIPEEYIENTLDNFEFGDAVCDISKNAALAGAGGLAIASGLTTLQDIRQKKLSKSQVLVKSLQNGQTAGLKIAISGALRVCTERRLLTLFGVRTPAVVYVGIASLSIEGVRILYQYFKGELTVLEAVDHMGRNSLSIITCIGFSTQGAVLGAAGLAVIPIVGPVTGAILGGMAGSIIGSKISDREYQYGKKMYSMLMQGVWQIITNDLKAMQREMQAMELARAYTRERVPQPLRTLWVTTR